MESTQAPHAVRGDKASNVRLTLDDGTRLEIRSAVVAEGGVVGADARTGEKVVVDAARIRKIEIARYDSKNTLLVIGAAVIFAAGIALLIAIGGTTVVE